MPRPKNAIPSYLHHKPSGQAIVKIRQADGSLKTHYLGTYGSAESRVEYGRIIGGHIPSPSNVGVAVVAASAGITISELILRFLAHADLHYRRRDGTRTDEVVNYRQSLRPLRHLFGALSAAEFGPKNLKAVRELMMAGYNHPDYGPQPSLCRKNINARVGRIVRVFKWAVVEELIPETVHRRLDLVPGLQAGRTIARETEDIAPVAWEVVERTLPKLNPVVRAMMLLMWHTGCRPGEVCSIKASEIDRSGPVWIYKPSYHKLAYRGKPRLIAIGKQGQEVLLPFLDRAGGNGYLFSPAQATAETRAAQQTQRRTKRFPCEDRRSKRRRKANPKKKPGERYSTAVLAKAIERAAERAGVEHWHPNRLRHAYATRVRAEFGLEEAQVTLGHSSAAITEVYAERNQALAIRVAEKMG